MKYIFGYGSLMNPESAARTLQRLPAREEMIPARLRGWRRRWQLCIEGYREDGGDSQRIVFLDIEPAPGDATMNGILLPVNDEEIARLDQRERHYNRTDVTKLITPAVDGIVYTYIGKDDCNKPPQGSVVMREYEKVVAEGLALWGKDFSDEYERTTVKHTFDLHEGLYKWKPKG